MDFERQNELRLIAEAILQGKLRRFRMGASSDWDDIPFRQRRTMLLDRVKKTPACTPQKPVLRAIRPVGR